MEQYQPGEPNEDEQSSQEIDHLVESIQVPTLPTIEPANDLDTDEEYTEYSSLDPSATLDTSSKLTIAPGLSTLQKTPELQQLVVQPVPLPVPLPSEPSQTETHSSTRVSADVSEFNIIEGSRSHKKSAKACAKAYFEDLEHLDDLPGYHAAFAVGIKLQKQSSHRDQLPAPPRSWKEMLKHPEWQSFEAAACREY